MKDRIKILAGFWLAMLVGIPYWWISTTVYRANLPFAQISKWSSSKSSFEFPLHFHFQLPKSIQISPLNDFIQNHLEPLPLFSLDTPQLSVKYKVHILQAKTPEEYSITTPGNYKVVILSNQKEDHFEVNNRTVVLNFISESPTTKDIGEEFLHFMKSFVGSGALTFLDPAADSTVYFQRQHKSYFQYAPKYKLTFSLMYETPPVSSVHWEMREAVESYLSHFLKDLESLYEFEVVSKVQFSSPLTIQLNRAPDNKSHYLSNNDLPWFINSAEWNLASQVSTHPVINFITFIPTTEHQPLYIQRAKDHQPNFNAFMIPRWGGVYIHNAKEGQRISKEVLKPIVEVFLVQLRQLLGIDKDSPTKNFLKGSRGITQFEVDRLLHEHTVGNFRESISTLSSLAALVERIPNMVVLDDIQHKVEASMEYISKVPSDLQHNVLAAFHYAKTAFVASESAFFDPTMVSMLYFPDEHKYAVYLPFFGPLILPLFLSCFRLAKEYKKSLAQKNDKKDK